MFVAATCGQGDAPLNMSANWRRLLMKDLSDALLANVSVAVVGLGDSSYEKYNFAAKRLFRRLLQLGATALCELALADDQHPLGIEGILGPWCDVFWRTVGDSAFFWVYFLFTVSPQNILLLRILIRRGLYRSLSASTEQI